MEELTKKEKEIIKKIGSGQTLPTGNKYYNDNYVLRKLVDNHYIGLNLDFNESYIITGYYLTDKGLREYDLINDKRKERVNNNLTSAIITVLKYLISAIIGGLISHYLF
ncbi:hypothetical protein FYL08_05800 [Lactobacillus salivarius]|jgi:hypothetical protein|uniref:hypothetical protein n=1 Tax=Ligilactobacillus salivarius TaxID=1624 RepID=UPI00136E0B91|nr:hypothetical protein [Ligilactobacillus salivarius]DAE58559.1 MAG TPA: hypothetical protein [Caudoviricetes sp.]MYU39452.1 hypothetical protein [Ligilactobacillus salivarius]MYU61084.1 hypothetical protein [Ligilactobacillus salivarius]MYU85873.1 hypothetical protein [Ligilactobacillus salivarius]MYU87413.1 hypothetical protein [Ligilactobacillus salivarius]